MDVPAPGGHHPGQRLREGERRALLPRAATREGGHPGRELPLRHLAAGPDDAAERVRPGRARRAAGRARSHQPASCRRSSTSRPSPGASRSARSRSSRSTFRPRCSARWRSRPRPSAKSAPRSSHAEGEFQAAQRICADAAGDEPQSEPSAIQLRYLQTLAEIAGGGNSSTTIFPVPLDMIRPFFEQMMAAAEGPRRSRPSEGGEV